MSNIFFITGMGRSGTLFMKNLLNQATNAAVFHETKGDADLCLSAYYKSNTPMSIARMMLIEQRQRESGLEIYGEVNSYLRYQPLFLQHAFDAKVIHLVRDPRKVVRSMMSRGTFTPENRGTRKIRPKQGDSAFFTWNEMTPFEKTCWYWNHAVTFLGKYDIPFITLEGVLTDFSYFETFVLKPLKITLSQGVWAGFRVNKVNKTESYQFPPISRLSKRNKAIFERYCMEGMEMYGYKS